MRFSVFATALLVIAACSVVGEAALITPTQSTPAGETPITWNRGDANSTYVHWDTFNSYPTDNTPDVSTAAGFNFAGTLTETTASGFLTSGGNVYSPSGVLDFIVNFQGANLAVPGAATRVVAQFKTIGSEVDYTSLLLDGFAPNYIEELSRAPFPGFGGNRVDFLAYWDLAGSQASYNLEFNAASSSLALDQLAIDSFSTAAVAVPEPASMVALAAAVAAIGVRRRRAARRAASHPALG